MIALPDEVVKNWQVTPKLWGYEGLVENNSKYCAKFLYLKQGFQSSLHYHHVKDETFFVMAGEVMLEITKPVNLTGPDRMYRKHMKPGDKQRLFPGVPHRFWAETPDALILEISTNHNDEDVVRIEESKAMNAINSDAGDGVKPAP